MLAGALAGAAAGSKFFGAVFAVLFALTVVVHYRSLRALLLYGCACAATGIWWYGRSYLLSGDPVHPFGGQWFGYFLWDARDMAAQAGEQAAYGVSAGSFNLIAALQEPKADYFIVGLATLLMPGVSKSLQGMRLIFIAYLLFWFVATQINRYLAPLYGVGAFLAAFFIHWLCWRDPLKACLQARMPRFIAGASVLMALVCLESIYSRAFTKADLDQAAWANALAEQPGYQLFTHAGEISQGKDTRLLQIGFENAIYYFPGQVIGDWFGPGRYRQFLSCPRLDCPLLPPAELAARMQGYNASLLALPKTGFLQWDRITYRQHFEVLAEDQFGYLLRPVTNAASHAGNR
ncbi:MAG: hypothetical protein ACK5ME_08620 [Parahaliea sp.]